MHNNLKIIYRLVMIIAALCGIIELLFKLNLVPEVYSEEVDKMPPTPERPIVVVIEQKTTPEQNIPAPNAPIQNNPVKPDSVKNDSAPNVTHKIEEPPILREDTRVIVEGLEFLELKDFYDKQISELAADVNAHISQNANYRNAGRLLERSERLADDIRKTEDALFKIKFKNEVWKNQLIKVIAAEFTRADGIREGVQSSYNGGSWKNGFSRGHNGKLQFDRENTALMSMYVKLVNRS